MMRLALSCLPLLVAIVLVMVSNGLVITLMGLRADVERFDVSTTGLVMSGYFIGYILSARFLPIAVRRFGHVAVYISIVLACAVVTLVTGLVVDPVVWFACRIVTGFSFAGMYIVSEGWINAIGSNRDRGGLLAIYMVLTFIALSLGQLALNFGDPAGLGLFVFGAGLLVAAACVMVFAFGRAPPYRMAVPFNLLDLWRRAPLGIYAGLMCGLCQAAFFQMTAVWGTRIGLDVKHISLLLALSTIGALIAQWPIGRLSDRIDRRLIIMGSGGTSCLVFLVATVIPPASVLFYAVPFLIGVAQLPLYALGISYVNDRLRPDQIIAASGTLQLVFGFGAILGPTASALVMAHFGPSSFWIFLAASQGAVVVAALVAARSSAPAPAR